ncbi:MAG TPA: hypothetical protein VIN61_12450 [Gammaproteobacteria bacterium]
MITSMGSTRLVLSAGMSPNRSTVAMVAAAANDSAAGSSVISSRLAASAGTVAPMTFNVATATGSPASPPSAASSAASASSCRTSRLRLAPIDVRTAISLARDAPLASSRFATFTHTNAQRAEVLPRHERGLGARGLAPIHEVREEVEVRREPRERVLGRLEIAEHRVAEQGRPRSAPTGRSAASRA